MNNWLKNLLVPVGFGVLNVVVGYLLVIVLGKSIPDSATPFFGLAFFFVGSAAAGFATLLITGGRGFWYKTILACPAIYLLLAARLFGGVPVKPDSSVFQVLGICWAAVVVGAIGGFYMRRWQTSRVGRPTHDSGKGK